MKARQLSSTLVCSFIACLTPLAAFAEKPTELREVVVFGDSLSDSGNLFAATMSTDPFPPDPPYYMGRFSNGPIWAEQMAANLGLPAPVPNLRGGTNYAWGGAETGGGLSVRDTPNLGLQIDFFLADTDRPRDDQLFMVWGGANDFNNAAVLPDPADVVANIVDHVTTLANAGAKRFVVPNMPPLGQAPLVVGTPNEARLDLLSIEFNFQLARALRSLENDLDIEIVHLDVFSLFELMLEVPDLFGFENVTGTAKLNPSDFFDSRVVDNPDAYVFFDYVHPTTVAHGFIGELAAFEVRKGFRQRHRGQTGKAWAQQVRFWQPIVSTNAAVSSGGE